MMSVERFRRAGGRIKIEIQLQKFIGGNNRFVLVRISTVTKTPPDRLILMPDAKRPFNKASS
jgi:hypothetical protein